MPSLSFHFLLSVLCSSASVSAHGHVDNIIINGVYWQGYDPTSMPYSKDPPRVVGWSTKQTDNGFVPASKFSSGDVICHKSATNAGGHAVVSGGDKVYIQWNTWPESHKGPVLDYLAGCGAGGCESVDKTSLEFFKIDEVGLVDGSGHGGTWGSDQLIANNNSWLVEIPSSVAPGFYVLRHEIIALHSAGNGEGAQSYPQCFNLEVTGRSGGDTPSGTKGEELYSPDDPGISINIYTTLTTYTVPGPALYTGAVSIKQSSSAATTTSSAITGSGTAPAGSDSGSTGTGTTPAQTGGSSGNNGSGSGIDSGGCNDRKVGSM